MKMGISEKLENGGGKEWELDRWECEGMGMLKAIPAHLYSMAGSDISQSWWHSTDINPHSFSTSPPTTLK